MTQALAPQNGAALLEKVVIEGDLGKLSPTERIMYYQRVCESLGLNALTRPFDYISLQGKTTLYPNKEAAAQLRRLHGISFDAPKTETIGDVFMTTMTAHTADGRSDSDIGAVPITGLKGEALANAMMKSITKAKRRVTLSISGLGMTDETELDTIPDAKPVIITATGEIVTPPPALAKPAPKPVAKATADVTIQNGHPRPYAPEYLKERFAAIVAGQNTAPVKDGFKGLVAHWLDLLFAGQNDVEQKRHSLTKYLTGKLSTNDLTPAELRASKVWLSPVEDSGGAWKINGMAEQEAQAVITQVMLDAGQQELPIETPVVTPAADDEIPF